MKTDDKLPADLPAPDAALTDEDLDGVDGGVLGGPGPSPIPFDTYESPY